MIRSNYAAKKFFSSKIAKALQEFDLNYPIVDGCLDGVRNKASGEIMSSVYPHDNSINGKIRTTSKEDFEYSIQLMKKNQKTISHLPIPYRAEIIKEIGMEFEKKKNSLSEVITAEVGKTHFAAGFEVMAGIGVCNYAHGLGRSINGQVLPSERRDHKILEVWNPLGIVGIITAFNFPQAVFLWGFTLSFLLGNQTIWKGSDATPLSTLAVTQIIHSVLKRHNVPTSALIATVGGPDVGKMIASDSRIPLVSFTGSTKIGKVIATTVAERLGRSLLELGGNNATIITENTNIDKILMNLCMGALFNNSQICNGLRRLIIQEKIFEDVKKKLVGAYSTFKIGDPTDGNTFFGPLISQQAVALYKNGIAKIKEQGGKILCGGEVIPGPGNYVKPTLVEIDSTAEILKEEIFAPILYLVKYKTLDEAIAISNNSSHGLAASLYTSEISDMMKWLGPSGSYTGMMNINEPANDFEQGMAFGGEKETGGGRQLGSDSWKQFARRGSCVINYGKDIQLAQGISFDV